MKIKVLGTGAVPSSRRSCGYLIDGCILLDNPNGGWKLMENIGYDLLGIDDILITHFHADHYFDMPFVFLSREGSTDKTLRIYCGESGPQYIDRSLELAFPDLYQFVKGIPIEYHHEDSFTIKNYSVRRYPVIHGNLPDCYSYVFDDGRQKVGFSGDSCLCEGLIDAIKGCRHFIVECSKGSESAMKGGKAHMSVADLEKLLDMYPDCRFYTTHMTTASRQELVEKKLRNVQVLEDLDELYF